MKQDIGTKQEVVVNDLVLIFYTIIKPWNPQKSTHFIQSLNHDETTKKHPIYTIIIHETHKKTPCLHLT